MPLGELLRSAVESLRVYRLRSFLIALSIAIGVVGIMTAGTAVSSLNTTVVERLAAMGENTIVLSRFPAIVLSGGAWRRYMQRKPITYEQGLQLKQELALITPFVTIYGRTPSEVVRWANRSTDPDVDLIGSDEQFFAIFQYEVAQGRPLTEQDLALNRPVVVLGADVAAELFGDASPLGQQVRIRNYLFEVVGVFKARGAVLGSSQDNFVLLPLPYYLRFISAESWGRMLTIFVKAPSREMLPAVIDEAVGAFRRIRGLKPWQESDFEVETNESIRTQFAGLTQYIGLFGLGTGAIALLAAGVGIMNMMLVAVRERTREIGIRKALGARRRWILLQFLAEAVALSLLGALGGSVLGILAGWGIAELIGSAFRLPWEWVGLSFGVCLGTGLVWGTYPAWKAAILNPVEALRYE